MVQIESIVVSARTIMELARHRQRPQQWQQRLLVRLGWHGRRHAAPHSLARQAVTIIYGTNVVDGHIDALVCVQSNKMLKGSRKEREKKFMSPCFRDLDGETDLSHEH